MYLQVYFCNVLKHVKLYLRVTVYCCRLWLLFTDLPNAGSKEENILQVMFSVANNLEMY